jgi:hypothetical protein
MQGKYPSPITAATEKHQGEGFMSWAGCLRPICRCNENENASVEDTGRLVAMYTSLAASGRHIMQPKCDGETRKSRAIFEVHLN